MGEGGAVEGRMLALVHEGVVGSRKEGIDKVGAAAGRGPVGEIFRRAAPELVDVVRVGDGTPASSAASRGLARTWQGGPFRILEQLLGIRERIVAQHVDDQQEGALVPVRHSHVFTHLR